jgi:hypothetical protein
MCAGQSSGLSVPFGGGQAAALEGRGRIQDAFVDHRGAHSPVAQQFLDGAEKRIIMVFQQVRSEEMAERMAGDAFFEAVRHWFVQTSVPDAAAELPVAAAPPPASRRCPKSQQPMAVVATLRPTARCPPPAAGI